VVHVLNPYKPLLVVDSVDDAVTTAPCGVPAEQLQVEGPADAMWVGGQSAVDELRDSGHDFLGQPLQIALRCR
jgi:hypothetical protein